MARPPRAGCRAGRRRSLEAVALLFLAGCPVEKGRAESPLEDVARTFLGPEEDVYYPEWFLGDWKATTELAEMDFPQGEVAAGKAAVREKGGIGTAAAIERYDQRYVKFQTRIIADRGFNLRGYVRGSAGSARALESVEWEPSRPNISTLTLKRDGRSVKTETRIMRRSVVVPDDRDDLFNSSELFQQVVEDGNTPTKVTPVRCVNKFKRLSASTIQVLQRVEVFPRLDGAAVSGDGRDPETPVVVYKYRGVLEKEVPQTGPRRGAL